MGARAAPVSIELIAGGACAKAASDGLAGGFEKALFLTFRIVGIGSQLENAQAKFLCRFLIRFVIGFRCRSHRRAVERERCGRVFLPDRKIVCGDRQPAELEHVSA